MGKILTVASKVFQRNIGKHLEKVLRGDTIIITRWNRPIAVLRPMTEAEQQEKGEG